MLSGRSVPGPEKKASTCRKTYVITDIIIIQAHVFQKNGLFAGKINSDRTYRPSQNEWEKILENIMYRQSIRLSDTLFFPEKCQNISRFKRHIHFSKNKDPGEKHPIFTLQCDYMRLQKFCDYIFTNTVYI